MAMREPTPDARAFEAYLDALRAAFLERESVLEQLALALLAQEHLLITGPPGTAKSALAHAVLGGIVEEDGRPSLFTRQLTEGAVQTDLLGPVDFKVLTETGRTRHLLEEGMLGHRYAFLDEVFDGRDMLLRAVLNALHERELKQGALVERGLLETAVLTSNRFLSEVVARVPELLLAFADRIPFQAFVPSAFARPGSRRALLLGATLARTPQVVVQLPRATLARLQALLPQVEVPVETLDALERLVDTLLPGFAADPSGEPGTRLFSQRTLVRALWVLRAAVVRDACQRPRELRASPEDLGALSLFFATAGPEGAELDAVLSRTLDPREQAQLLRLRHEHRTFAEALRQALSESRAALEGEAKSLELATLGPEVDRLGQVSSPEAAVARAIPLLGAVRERLGRPLRAENRQALLALAVRVVSAVEPQLSGPQMQEGLLHQVSEIPPLLDAPELAGLRRKLVESLGQAGLASRVRFLAEARTFTAAPPASIEGVGSAVESLARWAGALDPEDAELNEARRAAARAAAEALQLLLTGAGAVPGDAAGFARLRAGLDRAAGALRRLDAQVDLDPVARALALGHVAALGPDEPVLPAVDRLATAELLSDEVRSALAAAAQRRPRAVVAPPGMVAIPDALSGEAYRRYRTGLGRPDDDTARTLRRLGLEVQDGLELLAARVTFLRRWYDALHSALARQGTPSGGPGGEQTLASLVQSRFPALALKEGEFARLDTELQGHAGGPEARRAADIRAELTALAEGFGMWSRSLLAARS